MRSAGTETGARIKVTSGHIGWADLIFVMEKKHLRRLKSSFSPLIESKRVINLDIPDDYIFMDEDLIDLLISRVSEHIDVPE